MTGGRLGRGLRLPSHDFAAVFTVSEGPAGTVAALVMAGHGDPSGVGEIWVTCRESERHLLEVGQAQCV